MIEGNAAPNWKEASEVDVGDVASKSTAELKKSLGEICGHLGIRDKDIASVTRQVSEKAENTSESTGRHVTETLENLVAVVTALKTRKEGSLKGRMGRWMTTNPTAYKVLSVATLGIFALVTLPGALTRGKISKRSGEGAKDSADSTGCGRKKYSRRHR